MVFQTDFGAGGGGRPHTALRPPDFESGASASSATRARQQDSIYMSSGSMSPLYCKAASYFRRAANQGDLVGSFCHTGGRVYDGTKSLRSAPLKRGLVFSRV